MRQWNLSTNKHFKTFEESSTQTACKSSDKAVETMRHKLLLKSCWGMYKLWVHQHRFVKYAANVCLIFQRRSVRSVFQLWLLARKMERQLDALARRWWDNDMTMYVHQWRLKTVKNKRSSAFMIRGEERCLRGLLQDWRKVDVCLLFFLIVFLCVLSHSCAPTQVLALLHSLNLFILQIVDVRKSLALKFGLLKQVLPC